MFRFRRASILATLGAAALLAGSATADAAGAYYVRLANGNYGPQTQNGAPGAEQAVSEYLVVDGDTYIVTVYMQAYDEPNNNDVYWQLACNSTKLSSSGVPEVVAQRQLTNNNGERPGNHPAVTTDGKSVMMTYGNNAANGNTRTYARLLNHMCEDLTGDVRISNNNNANEGASDVVHNVTKEGVSYFTASYLSQTNPDRNYVRQLMVTYDGDNAVIENGFLQSIVTPCDIGRGNIAAHGEYSLACIPKGANRPPEQGIECAYISAMTGDIMWKQLVVQADPGNDMYYNQPRIKHIEGNTFGFYYIESNGAGQGTNTKGSNIPKLSFFTGVGVNGLQMTAPKDTPSAAHSGMCVGMYGESGKRQISILDGPITGLGLATMQFIPFSNGIIDIDNNARWVVNGENADSGYLQNLYGANPNTQGREFYNCRGDIPNPAFGHNDGFKANSETLFAFPHSARMMGEEKLSLYLALVDGKTAVPVEPEAPSSDPEDHIIEEPEAEPKDPEQPVNPDPNDPTQPGFQQARSSGGCTVAAANSSYGEGFAALMLGLGLFGLARRRREEV